ncbi:hypothetical protein KDA11_04480 [Candidatus Saccharibacteria bacterium]|nr:hypothetical protein [Candidatus Saccharibacteria bacterium]
MAVLDSSQKQNIIASSIVVTLVVAAVVFSLLIISSSTQLSQSTGVVVASFGFMKLVEISKLPLEGGGYGAGFRMLQAGVLQYFGAWLLAGLLLGVFRTVKNHN